MSPMPILSSTAAAPASRARPLLRGPENANSSQTLDGRQAAHEQAFENRNNGRRRTDLSHFGTEAVGPLWHGPRLRPDFVAQVLGQVLMDNHRSERPSALYRDAARIVPGSFFDAGV